MNSTITSRKISVKAQVIGALATIVAAVAFPQLCHLIGAAIHKGTAVGEIFLPMHLPIILCGIFAGPYAAAIAGVLGPVASFLMTGMPKSAMLPFMMIELAAYGFASGMLSKTRLPIIVNVLFTQIIGRAVRAAAIVFAFYVLGMTAINPSIILSSIAMGIAGIVLQLVIIPIIAKLTLKRD